MSEWQVPVLNGPRLILRAPRDSDVAERLALGNSPELLKMFGGDPKQYRPLTEDAARAWVDVYRAEKYAWIIELDGRMIGSVRLRSVNSVDRNATLAIGILDLSRLGRGVGTEAMRLVAQYAFGELGLHRLSLRVPDFNTRAIAAYQKVGFREEGRERENALIGGEWHDDVVMGLLAHEFDAMDSS